MSVKEISNYSRKTVMTIENQLVSKLFKLGNLFFLILGVLWLFSSIYFIYYYLKIDFTNLSSRQTLFLVCLMAILVFLLWFRKVIVKVFRDLFHFFNCRKKLVLFVIVVIQFVVTITSIRLASADSTIIYNIATNQDFALSTNYISINPNNYFLLLWMKLIYLMFGNQTILMLGIWNIFFIDASICLIYFTNKKCLDKSVSDLSYFLLVLILGLSPQYIYTYSDPIALFFLSLSLFLFVMAVKRNYSAVHMSLAGGVFAVANGFRPTLLIFAIAGVIVLFKGLVDKKYHSNIKLILRSVLLFLVSFLCVTQLQSFSLRTQHFVQFEEDRSRTLLYYIDLGLTHGGNEHADLPNDVVSAIGNERNISALSDIHRRLKNHDISSFTNHLLYKYYWMTNEGMFGWIQEKVLNEDSHLDNQALLKFQQNTFSRFIRSIVYTQGTRYAYYAASIQIIWIVISFSICIYPFFYSEKEYKLWMQIAIFGGLLYLLIFEAGRTRYLIQFLPAVITISACGLQNSLNFLKRNSLLNKF